MNKKPFIPAWLFEQGFSAQQLAIYCYVAMRGDCFETKTTMMRALRMGDATFYNALNALINAGWIMKITRGQGKSVTLKCQKQGRDMKSKPLRKKRKQKTRHDREAENMIQMDQLREAFHKNALDSDTEQDSNVA